MSPDPAPVPGLLVELRDGVLRLTLDRPDVLNAFSAEMAVGLASELERASARDEVRVVVLAGAGEAFSTGADLSGGDPFDEQTMDLANRMVRAVVACDKPVVAAVAGIAAGIGCSLALAADLQVAAESATFLLAFTRVGLMPDGGSSATVAAAVGRARAMRMALLAEPLPGRAAYDAGLVSHLAPDDQHADVVDRLARRLAGGPPLAFAATKRAINAATLAALEPALDREKSGQQLLMRTADVAEGIAAFLNRRRPDFRGH
ncbi:enoyl-CoA hydratase-related protein [Nocardioides dongkuii]|uniref:enoyl-CoA hydratase-related protein n=1 Tax=Nocardioides dongkuii TaxID=2760089 RepID=UPI001FD14079|nr:enoyl-CoA hydratase-related protein [Nocardioides dongkuii]